MDEKDSGTTTTTNDSLNKDDQDPAFIDEYTPLSPKQPPQEQEEVDDYVTTLFAIKNSYHDQLQGSDDKPSFQAARLHSIQWLIKVIK